ncbi:N-acetylmuramoyl-L-alanine amidase [Sphingomonas antarctica]|uniref:N-acetylmuramoyl-L-alanine amidase family protein n=1 Tax=Sphingomonas antarctica TaxID=2040274 RepID=UPI0039EC421B
MGMRAALASAGAVLMLALAALVMSLAVTSPARVETVLAAPLPVLPLPRIEGRAGRPLLVIDAGHGGHDPGASGSGVREKDVTLAVALAIRAAVLKQGRLRVALTRSDDRYLLLGERPEIARAIGAALFVSIHADSGGGSGATIYTLSEAPSDPAAARTAARENGASAAAGDAEVAAILGDLARDDRLGSSLAFAEKLHATAQGLPFKSEYRRSANFVVLRGAAMPAVLLELGYLSDAGDAARLRSPDRRAAIGDAVARAADLFLATRK